MKNIDDFRLEFGRMISPVGDALPPRRSIECARCVPQHRFNVFVHITIAHAQRWVQYKISWRNGVHQRYCVIFQIAQQFDDAIFVELRQLIVRDAATLNDENKEWCEMVDDAEYWCILPRRADQFVSAQYCHRTAIIAVAAHASRRYRLTPTNVCRRWRISCVDHRVLWAFVHERLACRCECGRNFGHCLWVVERVCEWFPVARRTANRAHWEDLRIILFMSHFTKARSLLQYAAYFSARVHLESWRNWISSW